MLTCLPLLPLFHKFIKQSKNGRRRNKNGSKIKPQSTANYTYCYKLLEEFQGYQKSLLEVYQVKGNNRREHNKLRKSYGSFYMNFTEFLYRQKKCYDNYVGQTIKQLRSFYVWLNQDMGIPTGTYYKSMYVCKEEIPILTLSRDQLHFLIHNSEFEVGLPEALKRSKDIFVFGCIVGLRFSDLISISHSNILQQDGDAYLKTRSKKTSTDTMIKLPPAAVNILKKYTRNKRSIFPSVSLNQFNKNIKAIALRAGWTDPVAKPRTRRGLTVSLPASAKALRFCDNISSHTMRRTSITAMLTAGMPEHVVRRISGHTSDSKSFSRYVNLAQSLMDTEIEKMHVRLSLPRKSRKEV